VPAPVSFLIPIADALTARDVRAGQPVPVAVWEVLTTLQDHRARRGRRHELATVLLVALAAVLAGARSFAGIAGWATDLPVWARPRLGITKRAPSLSTIRRTLLLVDPDVLDAVLHAWLAALAAPSEVPESLRAVAVDGKTCRGARTSGDTRVHLFSAVDHATGIPLGQVLAETKGHEIAAFATVLNKRNGTTTLFAALEVATGLVTDRCFQQHTNKEFLTFLKQVARAYPRVQLHVVCDNYATHKHPNVQAWLAKNPRVHMYFTPTSGSWLNMVEISFGIITRQAIQPMTRGTFHSVADLETAIGTYIDGWNQRAHPFTWTKSADEIIAHAKPSPHHKKTYNTRH